MQTEELKTYIKVHQEAMISDLAAFVEIPSISEDKSQVRRALDYILNLAAEMGFETHKAADGRVGVISMGEGDETVGILSHVDVVPPGELSVWDSDPFTMTLRDGRLYGRGTLDDKGAIIASLYAMKAVKDSGQTLHKKVQLIMGTQEEVEWSDMAAYVKENPLPDYGFTPDGEFPLCNIEKGGIDLLLRFPLAYERLEQGEACNADLPKDGWHLTGLQAGTVSNAVPGSCRAVLTEYRDGKPAGERVIETAGKSVHSCQPEKGENALFIMGKRLQTEDIHENRLFTILRWLREKLGDVYGRQIGLYSTSEYYNGEFVHRNVMSPTVVRTEDGQLSVNVNIRFAYGSQPEDIIQVFKQLAAEQEASVEVKSVMPAVYVSKDRPFIKAFARAYEEGCGRKNQFALEYGGTYAKAMPNIVSWGPVFPDDEDTCHEINEHIKVETLLENGKIFAIALAEIALSEESFK